SVAGWLAAQEELSVALTTDDARPRRGTLLGLGVTGSDGRTLTAEDGAAGALLAAIVESHRPLYGHEVKRVLVAQIDARDRAALIVPDRRALPAVSFDTQIAAYLLNAALRSQTLPDIAAERLGVELLPSATFTPGSRAGIAALAAAAARGPLEQALRDEGLERLFDEVELPLIAVLAAIEAVGVKVDDAALDRLRVEFGAEIARLEQEIYRDIGHEFNLGSPKQLEQVLFFELNMPKGRRTKTGYSTDAAVLEELRAAHPAIGKI